MLEKTNHQLLDYIKETPAWAVSLGVHAIILMLMASITFVAQSPNNQLLLSSVIDEAVDEEQFLFDATVSDQVGTDSNFDTLSPSLATTVTPEDPQEQIDQQLEEENLEVEVPTTELVASPSDAELVESVEVAGQTEHPGGVAGAMDRLTFELASSLSDRPTLVIWLFDASNSLNQRREAIAKRFETVYSQLGVLEEKNHKKFPLETAVVSFGKQTKFITEKPVHDVTDLVEAIRKIEPDASGEEKVFNAVSQVSRRWQSYKTKLRRNVMIIIITDEKGDDVEILEKTIAFNKRYGMRVYCVGNAALFGRDKGYISHTWEEDGKSFTMDLEADQGPETIYSERLQLPFWGGGSGKLDRMSASFGPYALTRLCAETGGLYLVAAEGSGPTFDPSVMRNYPPDYRPIRLFEMALKKSLAKQSVLQAAQLSRVNRIPIPTLEFRADNDNILRQQVTEAQKPLAILDYHLNSMMAVLERGVQDRDKLKQPRWRASYDLAAGRVLAMRARSLGYNEMCAEMKSSPRTFEDKKNNFWRLIPSNNISSGPSVKKMAAKANEFLSRVIDEHPGTPWELLAGRELQQPLGWEWQEFHRDVPALGSNDPEKAMLLLAEERKKKAKMKQQTGPKNIPKL